MTTVDPKALRDRLTEAERRDQVAIDCYDGVLADLAEIVDRTERNRDYVERTMRARREAVKGKAAPEVWEWVYEPGDHVKAVRCEPHDDCPGRRWQRIDGRWQEDDGPALHPWPNLLYRHSKLIDATGEAG